jgi:hypothetical protein
MLWAPRVTFIDLHREQSGFGEGSGELEGTQLRRCEEQDIAWQGGATSEGKLREKD